MPTPAADVAHLLRRAGFSATPAEVAPLTYFDRATLVELVLLTDRAPAVDRPAALDDTSLKQYQRWVRVTQWWLDRMATSPTPLVEKMTLFWHNHFVTSQEKVFDMDLMWQQNVLYRSLALGDFRDLTHQMAVHPAMLEYLDNFRNRVGALNQNFSRELLELFTIGNGNYGEGDVDACTRAWTGHTLDDQGRYAYRADWHDNSQRRFRGVVRRWQGPEIIEHLLTDPVQRGRTARLVARKLWLHLAGPEPSGPTLRRISDAFAARLSITDLLRAIFLDDAFWSPAVRTGLVRSPVDLVVAVMRATGLTADQLDPELWLEAMGQSPFNPPNVAGWKTNEYWVSASAIGARADFLRNAARRARANGVLEATLTKTPQAALQMAFDLYGLDRVTARTRSILIEWIRTQRSVPHRDVVVPENLLVLVPLTPDFQLL